MSSYTVFSKFAKLNKSNVIHISKNTNKRQNFSSDIRLKHKDANISEALLSDMDSFRNIVAAFKSQNGETIYQN